MAEVSQEGAEGKPVVDHFSSKTFPDIPGFPVYPLVAIWACFGSLAAIFLGRKKKIPSLYFFILVDLVAHSSALGSSLW